MFDRFTENARKVVNLAKEEARALKDNRVRTEHILLGLVKVEDHLVTSVLQKFGLSFEKIDSELQKQIQSSVNAERLDGLAFTQGSKKVIEEAMNEARRLQSNYLDVIHLLLGLIKEQGGTGGQVLRNLGLELDLVRNEVVCCSKNKENNGNNS